MFWSVMNIYNNDTFFKLILKHFQQKGNLSVRIYNMSYFRFVLGPRFKMYKIRKF